MKSPSPDLIERARAIRAIVMDVDGVLTDSTLTYGPKGESAKRFSARDGFAIRTALTEGVHMAILSGRQAPAVKVRAADLGMPPQHVFLGSRDKAADLDRLASILGVGPTEIAFMGDDLPDLPALARAGLAACPADAEPEVLQRCHFVSSAPGGRGAVRELIELVLCARGRWDAIVQSWAVSGAPPGFYEGETGSIPPAMT